MTDSDLESENKAHGAVEDFTGISGVATEWNNPPRLVKSRNEFVLSKEKQPPVSFCKNPPVSNKLRKSGERSYGEVGTRWGWR